ncbi:MAG TPA: SPOR domain-containing protein [Methylomirabilota bacterium]|jgi:cell division septation protein DedD|nr:SPOR domain-containing protein [Methylomirabilota bacterium]
MQGVRSDPSRRGRQPSIFGARWFRVALGVGGAMVLALLVGPSLAGWFEGDLPQSVFLLAPWSPADETPAAGEPEPVAQRPSTSSVASAAGADAARGTAAIGKTSGMPVNLQPATGEQPPTEIVPARPVALGAPPVAYWVQVGAFLDHRNADRLAERLRGDGLTAATTAFEQSRVLYRVLLVGPEGGGVSDDVIERVRGLGHPVDATAAGPAVAGLVPLRRAVEMSHTLREQGVPVWLKQEVSSSTYRVVRVGSFGTVADAEAMLATLSARGVEGVVVRER